MTRSTRRGEGDDERMGGRRQCEKRRIREGNQTVALKFVVLKSELVTLFFI